MNKEQELVNYLEKKVSLSKDSKEDPKKKNWDTFEGILISPEEAQTIITKFKDK